MRVLKPAIVLLCAMFCVAGQQAASQTLLPPALVAPSDGALVTQAPLLQWAQVAGNIGYDVQVRDTLGVELCFTTLPANASSWTVSCFAGIAVGQRCLWRVRTRAPGGSFGLYSAERSFRRITGNATLDLIIVPSAPQLLFGTQSYSFTFSAVSNGLPVDQCDINFTDPFTGAQTLTTVSDGTAYFSGTVPGAAAPGVRTISFSASKAGYGSSPVLQRTLVVLSTKLALSVQPASQTIAAGDTVALRFLVSSGSWPIADADVEIREPFTGMNLSVKTDATGNASVRQPTLPALPTGTYTVACIARSAGFTASDTMKASIIVAPKGAFTLTVLPVAAAVVDWGEQYSFSFAATDGGVPLQDAAITFIDSLQGGTRVTLRTEADGTASYLATVPDNSADRNYSFVFQASKSGYTNPNSLTRTVTVRPVLSLGLTPSEQEVRPKGRYSFRITASARGNPVPGVAIRVVDPLVPAKQVTTDTAGAAVYAATVDSLQAPGDYTIIFSASKTGTTSLDTLRGIVRVLPAIQDTTAKDSTAPALTLLSPVPGKRYAQTSFAVILSASDAGSGVDSTSLVMHIDGVALLDNAGRAWRLAPGKRLTVPDTTLAAGTHTFVVSVRDRAGNTARDSVVFEIYSSRGVIVTSANLLYTVSVFPNPTSAVSQLSVKGEEELPGRVTVCTVLGARVAELPLRWSRGASGDETVSSEIDVSGLRPGTYFLLLQTARGPVMQRLTKF